MEVKRDIMKVQEGMFAAHEQPNDGTRYTHLIDMDNYCAYVYRDLKRGGAGFNTPKQVGFHELEYVDEWIAKGLDAFDMAMDLQSKGYSGQENVFTYASVLRCLYEIYRKVA